jgi:hypothetical protein
MDKYYGGIIFAEIYLFILLYNICPVEWNRLHKAKVSLLNTFITSAMITILYGVTR